MKKRSMIGTIFLICVMMLWTSSAFAIVEKVGKEAGFSGFFRPGVGYLDLESNMVAEFLGWDLSKNPINSLTASPEGESNAIFTFPFQVSYTFDNLKTEAFLGTTPGNLARFDASQQLGIKHDFGNIGILQGGLLFSGLAAKVWADPYVTGTPRVDTDRDSTGARLAWGKIMGSGLHFILTARKIDIDEERSGSAPALGLTGAQRTLLDRNGDETTLELVYDIDLGGNHRLAPAFLFTKDDRDGNARNNDEWNLQLTYAYLGADPFSFNVNGVFGKADYDQTNPIFNKTQEDDIAGLSGTMYYKNPWGWSLWGSNPINFFGEIAWYQRDADIDFYDEEATLFQVGVMLRWK
jgi:hypothetical protein